MPGVTNKRKKKMRATERTWKIVAVFSTILAILFCVLLVKTTVTGAQTQKVRENASAMQQSGDGTALFTSSPGQQNAGETASSGSLAGSRIIVDAGHGDTDVGTIGPLTGRYEKEVNLEIALKLKAALEQKGVDVVMTRGDDSPLGPDEEQDVGVRKEADMQKREEIIENANADLFVSIHQNRFDDASVAGPQVLYLRTEGGQEYGTEFANAMQNALNEYLPIKKPRGINGGDWRLLKKGDQPGVIIECGFFSNPEEEELLQTGEYQNKLVTAILNGIENYLL
ncbi:N-acetylmuramoyl-L-alanine amidase [Christensenellaceae bacterium OttesenSCG-928-K19]|nr:N-acetylmuramoyl-L-alanine amidase [Christensenellaceae bacterium OttesenSCG-928-K19]